LLHSGDLSGVITITCTKSFPGAVRKNRVIDWQVFTERGESTSGIILINIS